MPKLTSAVIEQNKIPNTSYGYSGVRLEDLGDIGATEYTLATILVDVSSSVSGFKAEMESCLKEIARSCQSSPRSDNLMLRVVSFADSAYEELGFSLLSQINMDDIDLKTGGMTALFQATENALYATGDYAKKLYEENYTINSIVFIITDGMNNRAPLSADNIKKVLNNLIRDEYIESIVTILIGVNINDRQVSQCLKEFKDEAGLDAYEELKDATASTLAKVAGFVSKSISAQSQHLGTGGPSQVLKI